MPTTDHFFSRLTDVTRFASVVESAPYSDVPPDWCVAITDVVGSTAAIMAGRYKDVNALGAACIVAVLNAAPDLSLPYVFGGDGATLLFPSSRRQAVEHALRGMARLAVERFGLQLRVGVVPVSELVAAGHPVRVARFRPSPQVTLAMLAGSGVTEAERRVKDPLHGSRYSVEDATKTGVANLTGFECRWEPLPNRHGHMVSLLIQATDSPAHPRVQAYQAALRAIDEVLGDVAQANPAHHSTLKIASKQAAFRQEAHLRGGRNGVPLALGLLKTSVLATVGRTLLATGWRIPGFNGATYRDEVVINTDFRKFDEMLRMVIDISDPQLDRLRAALDQLQDQGQIRYGLHTSSDALMTCLVTSHEGDHVHFVDGADGGYAMAALPLKAALKAALKADLRASEASASTPKKAPDPD